MIKPIVRDIFFLGQKAERAVKANIAVGRDLLDTLQANRDRCVGMAANMIGVRKAVIVVHMGAADIVMFNPVVLKKEGPYEAEVRKTTRYEYIEVEFYDMSWKKRRQKLRGLPAQICQHELDHLEGILI